MYKKTAVIIGAGQMGRVFSELIDPNTVEITGYGDNDHRKWSDDGELRVMSVEEAVDTDPDMVLIGVAGISRADELKQQVISSGYSGPVISAAELRDMFDIRSRCMRQLALRIESAGIPGAMAELGVYRGDLAWQMNMAMPDRKLYLFDTFSGFDQRDMQGESTGAYECCRQGAFRDTSAGHVMSRMPFPDNVIIREGFFPETASGLDDVTYSLVSLDPDLYRPALEGLEYFVPRISSGGAVILHDYDNQRFPGIKKAVDEYEASHSRLHIVPLGDLHGSCVIML